MEDKRLEEKISYSYISENNIERKHLLWFETYGEAYEAAKFDQPADRPYLIVERTEHFEVCGRVKQRRNKSKSCEVK